MDEGMGDSDGGYDRDGDYYSYNDDYYDDGGGGMSGNNPPFRGRGNWRQVFTRTFKSCFLIIDVSENV